MERERSRQVLIVPHLDADASHRNADRKRCPGPESNGTQRAGEHGRPRREPLASRGRFQSRAMRGIKRAVTGILRVGHVPLLALSLGLFASGAAYYLYARQGSYEVIWERYLGIGVDQPIIRAADGGYAFFGDGALIRLNEDGTERWRHEGIGGWALVQTRDGGFVAAHSVGLILKDGSERREGEPITKRGFIRKISATGQLVWRREVSVVKPDDIARLGTGARTSDGFVLFGDRAVPAELDSRGFVRKYDPAGPWIVQFDDEGTVIWDRFLRLAHGYARADEMLPSPPIVDSEGNITVAFGVAANRGEGAPSPGVYARITMLVTLSAMGEEKARRAIDGCSSPSLLAAREGGFLLVCRERTQAGEWLPSLGMVRLSPNLTESWRRSIPMAMGVRRALGSEDALHLAGTADRNHPALARLDREFKVVGERHFPPRGSSQLIYATLGALGDEVVFLWYDAKAKPDGSLDAVVKVRFKK